jgi:hypothetical protein
LESARNYIDRFTGKLKSNQSAQYCEARDSILEKLTAAFASAGTEANSNFLSFIGYPPVLDAIVTLLQSEGNYHRLKGELEKTDSNAVATDLLYRIAAYVARREKEQKVVPNIVLPLVGDMPTDEQTEIAARVFEPKAQYMRLISYCLGTPLTLAEISEPILNARYEEQIAAWLPEHPFIAGRQFRNAVFEAIAIATLIASSDVEAIKLALGYLDVHRFNYYVVYLLDLVAQDRKVPVTCLRAILGCAMEFQSRSAAVQLHVTGPEMEGRLPDAQSSKSVETEIEIVMGVDGDKSKRIVFNSDLAGVTSVQLGNRLFSTYVSLPCDVVLSGPQEIELTAPIEISAKTIELHAPHLC